MKRMKAYTLFTPSHKELYEDYFLKTLPNEFELHATELFEQECPTGRFYEEGWDKICRRKVELFVSACEENMGGSFFYCDVDVQFFGNVVDQLVREVSDFDIACQDDVTAYCSGVFICKANQATLAMFKEMKRNYNKEDQATLNEHLQMCRHKKLSEVFFTVGHIAPRPWQGETFRVPKNMLLHHANFVIGVENKKKIMDYTRENMQSHW
ncbi:MAG: putative nucleotide-diphospho-sugar transferase [Pirellulales bacterium]